MYSPPIVQSIDSQETSMKAIIASAPIEKSIYVIRNQTVMLDSDLAKLYGVQTRNLNLAV